MIPNNSNEERHLISEIFYSIQGESSLAGERFTFIRLTGCPLRCKYCDTKYSYSGGKLMTTTEILSVIEPHKTKHVLITGGEPLAHKNTIHLVNGLLNHKKTLSIETGGEEDVLPFIGKAKIIMDIKTPDSGEIAKQCFKNLTHLLSSDEIKFVICNREDYLWTKTILEKYDLTRQFTVLLSPSFDQLPLKTLAEWILEDRLNVRLQTQLHKHIWDKNMRGV